MHSLPLFHRIAGEPVIVLGEGEAAEAKRRLVERAGGIVADDIEAPARLAFVALAEPEAAVTRLRERGVSVNAVDRPDLCDFTVPSLLERGPMLVAVSSGGLSAGLTKAVRLRLEGFLPASLGALAEALGAAKAAIKARWPDPAERRRVLDAAVGESGALDLLRDFSPDAVTRWLESGESEPPQTREFTLPGDDPDDLTLRQARWLGEAGVVAYEPGVPAAVLNRARADAAQVAIAPGEAPPDHPGAVVVIRRR
ncbi:MAG: precorrin-2 dehydrogenase/sirohydrochlorin ferrochelatase family protein [Novosphingobium sp.]